MRDSRLARRWLDLCAALLIALGCVSAHAGRATDDRGVTLDVARPPQRIVSLLPSLAETVCALGRCDALVAVDEWTHWPASVNALPHVGGLEDADIERIVSLRPDLVLASTSSRATARLESLGVRVFALEPKTLADVHRTLDRIGALLDRPREAADAWQRLNAGIDEAARSVPPALRGTTVYFEVASGPYAASEISHIGELLTRLGAVNVVPGRLGSVPKLNPEFVVRADPQVIVIGERDAPSLASRPGWSRIRAIRDRRVCALTTQQGDVVARPGPRLAEAARVLASCLAGGAR